jgi:hypothetical protein
MSRITDPTQIKVSDEHHQAMLGLLALLLEVDESTAKKIWSRLAGKPGRMSYGHLARRISNHVTRAVEAAGLTVGTDVYDFEIDDATAAITSITHDTPVCPNGHLPFNDGTQQFVTEGVCPIQGCGELISKPRAVRAPFNWVLFRIMDGETQTHDSSQDPTNPIPITEECIRDEYTVHPDIDAALTDEGANLVEFMAYVRHGHDSPARGYGVDSAFKVLRFIVDPYECIMQKPTIQLTARRSVGFWRQAANSGEPQARHDYMEPPPVGRDRRHVGGGQQVINNGGATIGSQMNFAGGAHITIGGERHVHAPVQTDEQVFDAISGMNNSQLRTLEVKLRSAGMPVRYVPWTKGTAPEIAAEILQLMGQQSQRRSKYLEAIRAVLG